MSFGVQSTTTDPWASQQTAGTTSTSLRPFANLNLTEDQRTKIRSILQNAKSQGTSQTDVQSQINGVLTPGQQQTLQSNLQQQAASSSTSSSSSQQQTGTLPKLFANLNLTSDQQQQIQSILQTAQSNGTSKTDVQNQILAVLTPSQQATFQSNVQNAQSAGSGRHRHKGGDGDATSTTDGTSSATLTNGLTQSDIQNAVLAAQSLLNQQNPAQTSLG
jgi:Spy/CpxP family protein refolding chaperone